MASGLSLQLAVTGQLAVALWLSLGIAVTAFLGLLICRVQVAEAHPLKTLGYLALCSPVALASAAPWPWLGTALTAAFLVAERHRLLRLIRADE